MSRLVLRPGKEKSLLRRHPWVYASAVARVEGDPASGATIEVRSADGRFLAWAAYSPASTIRARAWSFSESARVDADMLAERVRACGFAARGNKPGDERGTPRLRRSGRPAGTDRRSVRGPAGDAVPVRGRRCLARALDCGADRGERLRRDLRPQRRRYPRARRAGTVDRCAGGRRAAGANRGRRVWPALSRRRASVATRPAITSTSATTAGSRAAWSSVRRNAAARCALLTASATRAGFPSRCWPAAPACALDRFVG